MNKDKSISKTDTTISRFSPGPMSDLQKFIKKIKTFVAPDTKPMAAVVIRFSGRTNKHIGKSVIEAIEKAVSQINQPLYLVGRFPNKGKAIHLKTAKCWESAGKTFLYESLRKTVKIGSGWDQQTIFYLKDGENSNENRKLPDRFAIYCGMCKDDFNGGYLTMALPLEDLVKPTKWFQIIEGMMEYLNAEVASLSPALWSLPQMPLYYDSDILKNQESPETLGNYYSQFPQVMFPLYEGAGHTIPPDGVKPNIFSGFLFPTWVMWTHDKLSLKVKKFPGNRIELLSGITRFEISTSLPFNMSESEYQKWLTAWASMKDLHLTYVVEDLPESDPYLSRFNSSTLSEIKTKCSPKKKLMTELTPLKKEISEMTLDELYQLLESCKETDNRIELQKAADRAMELNARPTALKFLEIIFKKQIWSYGLYGEYGLIGTKNLKKLKNDLNFKALVKKYWK